jgi:hypothetical protein
MAKFKDYNYKQSVMIPVTLEEKHFLIHSSLLFIILLIDISTQQYLNISMITTTQDAQHMIQRYYRFFLFYLIFIVYIIRL